MNRKQKRIISYNKPTHLRAIATENGKIIAYIHPTKGYRGQKKAIAEFKTAMGYK